MGTVIIALSCADGLAFDPPPLSSQFDVRDITNFGFKSMREVCPLKPEYVIHGRVIRDDPRATHPRPLPAPADHPYYSLKTDDIDGAQVGPGRRSPTVRRRAPTKLNHGFFL
jgi:hypothetical protein